MRTLLLCLLLAACAGSQAPANSAADAQASFDERTRERWKREEEQRQIEQRRNSFTSNSAQRGDVQPTW
jgi:Skp family chaperone for outer membrane proteins